MTNEHSYVYDLLRKLGLSDFGASTGEFLLVRPLKIGLLVLIGIVAIRVGGRAARRFVRTLHARAPLRTESVRAEQRAATVADALASLVRGVVMAVIGLLILGEVGVDLGPLVAGAGIAGIAVGFGAQSLVRDVLSGFFIVLEDQYGVGDVINLGDATGTVEDVSLRVTRLRNVDGTVWFVPNGEIRRVGNTSMEWSRAVVDIPVPLMADAGVVVRAVEEITAGFAADPRWQPELLEPPEVQGVHAVGVDSVTVRVLVKTAPRQQHAVARELRARVVDRLRRDGVWALMPQLGGPVSPSPAAAPPSGQ